MQARASLKKPFLAHIVLIAFLKLFKAFEGANLAYLED